VWLSSWKPQESFLATGLRQYCMYANVATGPRSGQPVHASEHEDEERCLGQTVATWDVSTTAKDRQLPTASPCCAEHNVQEVGEAPMHDPGPE
jgi:hypothetical protein